MNPPDSSPKIPGYLRKHYRIALMLVLITLFVYFMLPPNLESQFKQLSNGMHRSEVIRLLGEPRNLSMYDCMKPFRFNNACLQKEEFWVTITVCYRVFYDATDHVDGFYKEQPDLIDKGLILNVAGYFKRRFQKADGSHTLLPVRLPD